MKKFDLYVTQNCLYILFMFWCTEILFTVPGFFIEAYQTSGTLFDQFIPISCFGLDSSNYRHITGIKLLHRIVCGVLNLTLIMKFTSALEQEDVDYFELQHLNNEQS